MKRFRPILFALAMALSMQMANAQTADEIIDKHIDAVGGKERIAALKSVKMTGSLNVQGMDIGLTITVVQGVGARTDISVPGMGEGFQIMNPTKGWSFMPFQGQASPEEVTKDKVQSGQTQLDVQGALYDYKTKGSTAEFAGKETMDGSECFKLKVTNKDGKVSTYFIDAKTYYKVKVATKSVTASGETDVETSYSDFKPTPEGYVFPFTQTNPMGTVVFSTIEINKTIDSKIFTAE